MSGYRGRSRSSAPRVGRWMDLKYAGTCHVCDKPQAVGARAFYDPADRMVTCLELECCFAAGLTREVWHGSPVSGSWVRERTETRMRSSVAPAVNYGRGNHRSSRPGYRCEDAPCCGCCD